MRFKDLQNLYDHLDGCVLDTTEKLKIEERRNQCLRGFIFDLERVEEMLEDIKPPYAARKSASVQAVSV